MADVEITYRPLALFPPAMSSGDSPRRSQFEAPHASTLYDLRREVRLLGAARCLVELGVREHEVRADGNLRSNHRVPVHPGVVVSFDSDHGPLRYGTDRFDRWEDNLRAVALALEALRKVDRYGVGGKGEQYAGWKALPPSRGEPSIENGRRLSEEAGSVKRALKVAHPDHGGDSLDFADVRAFQKHLESGNS